METFSIEEYDRVAFLGRGAFGQVTLWKKKEHLDITETRPEYVALKGIQNSDDPVHSRTRQRELRILSQVQQGDNRNLIRYYGYFEESTSTTRVTNLAMQACHGDLRQLITCRRQLGLNELKDIGKQLLLGMEYLHSSEDITGAQVDKIIHRDLKPENILIYVFGCTPGVKPNWERLPIGSVIIKIADFGCGRHLTAQDTSMYVHTVAGTLEYMAPEVLSESYGVKADIWSFGIIMHELATKERPHLAEDMTRALHGHDRLTENYFFIPFVSATLKMNSKHRPSAKELLAHPFLTDEAPSLTCKETINCVYLTDENIIIGGREGSIHVIDADNLKRRRMAETEKCHTDVNCVTSCGPTFAAAGGEGKISLWRTCNATSKCELLKVINCHGGKRILCIEMNNNWLVSRGSDKNIVIHRQSHSIESQIESLRLGANQMGNTAQNQEDLVQCGVIKSLDISKLHSMVLIDDQLYFTDFHHLKHYSLSRSSEPQLVTQMEFKEPLECLTPSDDDISASGATRRENPCQPRYFWVGTGSPAKIVNVDLVNKLVLSEVEVWNKGFVRQLKVVGQFLLCYIQEPKTNYTSCLCYALSDLPQSGASPQNQSPVPFRQFVQFGGITSNMCCRHDKHVFYYKNGDFHHLSVKDLEALPKQTSLTLHPDMEQ